MRTTKQQLQDDVKRLEREAMVYGIAVGYLARGDRPDATVTWTDPKDEGHEYVANVYGTERADGGVVVITFTCPGQRDSTVVDYWEAWSVAVRNQGFTEYTTAEKCAEGHLARQVAECMERAA